MEKQRRTDSDVGTGAAAGARIKQIKCNRNDGLAMFRSTEQGVRFTMSFSCVYMLHCKKKVRTLKMSN